MRVLFRKKLLRFRVVIIILIHIIFAGASITTAFLLRFDFTFGPETYQRYLLISLPINIIIFVVFSAIFNLFQGIWRYVSIDDLKDLIKTSFIASVVFMCVVYFSRRFPGYPRSIYPINMALFIFYNGGTRFAIRMFREAFVPMADEVKNVLIVGAGPAGNEIAKTLKSAKHREFHPVGFIHEDGNSHGNRIQGIKILGDLSSCRQIVKRYNIHEVFIAIPEATNKMVAKIIESARVEDWDIKFKIVPSMLDIMSGRLQVNQIRDVSIDDLLSRPNIQLEESHIKKQINGKKVFITGAGGSIGAEISYQLAAYKPSEMLLLDSSEENAYYIDKSIKKKHPDLPIHVIVGHSFDEGHMDALIGDFRPHFIFHAAAYKHVHLMEWNPRVCFKNNIIGTEVLAAIAEKYKVQQFVMISTDKAVNPSGVMGLSKRLAERVVLERKPTNTLFNVVRFGNVLGSSGSVIPLFQEQIKDGGPITVTSEKVKRYFMSIPEAVQLVLQAATLEQRNAIFLLDMGEPVLIKDLAENLIKLSGLKVGDDIDIEYIGMRPGEKIEEELLSAEENLIKTPFEKVRIQKNTLYNPESLQNFITRIQHKIDELDPNELYKSIKELVPEMSGPAAEEFKKNYRW